MVVEVVMIVILGMSIAGLVTALEAIQSSKKVFMLERFESFSRNQTVVIDTENNLYLKIIFFQVNSLKNKKKIPQDLIVQFNKIYDEHINDKAIAIKYLQRMLFLACQIAAKVFKKSEFNYKRGEYYQIQDIDIEKQNLMLINMLDKKVDKIEFKILVDTTGASRATLKLATWPEKPKEIVGERKLKSFSYIMQGSLKEGLTPSEQEEAKFVKKWKPLQYLNTKFTLKLQQPPVFGYSISKKKSGVQRFHVAGELPDGIPEELIPEWSKSLLFFRVKQSVSQLKSTYKDPELSRDKDARKLKNRTSLSVFESFVSGVEKPIYLSTSKQAIVVYLGDARLTHIFHLGEGANKAIRDGKIFRQCLETDDGFNVELFKKLVNHDVVAEEQRQFDRHTKLLMPKLVIGK